MKTKEPLTIDIITLHLRSGSQITLATTGLNYTKTVGVGYTEIKWGRVGVPILEKLREKGMNHVVDLVSIEPGEIVAITANLPLIYTE